MLEVRILGALELCGDGGLPIALGGRKQRTLLALLVLHANEPVTTDRLLEEVWPGAHPRSAARSLQVTVSNVRKALGDEAPALKTRPGAYALVFPPERLDAWCFECLLREGRQALEAGEPEQGRATLAEALAIWRGPPFADLAYESCVQPEAARLGELRLVCLEERIGADLALAHHAELVPELEALLAAHPLRERLRAQLMLAFYRAGRQADALAVYQEGRRALLEELGLEPGPELRQLETAILRHDPTLRVEPPELRARRHLPAPATALVGRRDQVEELTALLRGEAVRLCALTGPGGIGKTRLALQVAYELADTFSDGVFFVGLAPLRDPALVISEIGQALDVTNKGPQPLFETVADHLRERRVLLLIDNFEHVDEAAPLLAELLRDAPGLTLLVTSRSRLRLYGEHEYAVPRLALEEEALPLFTARAQAVEQSFRLSETSAPAVREICLRLDCLPLAIELVAARAARLSLGAMLAGLGRLLELAVEGPRDLAARQQTLRATIAWSYELLGRREQEVFAPLAVFAGGSTLEAAQDVCEVELPELVTLVDSNLVRELADSAGETRLAMLETVREFALERLSESTRLNEVRRRHAAHFLALAELADGALEAGDETVEWLDRLEIEHDNLRAALDWAVEVGDVELELRLGVTLGRFWEWRSHLREGLERLLAALGRAGTAHGALRARALMRAGVFSHYRGEFAGARELVEEALAVARELGEEAMAADGLRNLGALAKDAGELEYARALHEEARALSEGSGDRLGLSSSLINLSDIALAGEDYSGAERLAQESVLLAQELGHEVRELTALLNLGLASLRLGRESEARETYREAVELSLRLRYPECLVVCLEGLAALEAEAGDPARAARLMGAAEALLELGGYVLEAAELHLHEHSLASVKRRLGDTALEDAWCEGRSLSFDEAAEEAARVVA